MINTEGEDISLVIEQNAVDADVDPVYLLALIKAESKLNPYAERWGAVTTSALLYIQAIKMHGSVSLQHVIDTQWPDISFGYGQQIVKYHFYGNGLPTVDNCLDVRHKVFANPNMSIRVAARQLNSCIARSMDGSPLGGMVVYNAGSDRRADAEWMSRWVGNVTNYERALKWAEQYRQV